MANVLCQIRGSKRVVLFPPSDAERLEFPAGSSSSHLDVFSGKVEMKKKLEGTHPLEAVLQPGEVLFIPPLWAHTASPMEGSSISVNVFFRNLDHGYAAGKDVYGNRDVQAYETGRRDIAKIVRAFQGLPVDFRQFYLKRLAAELVEQSNLAP